jgi:hypothetical protein
VAVLLALSVLPSGGFTKATQCVLLPRSPHWSSAAEVHVMLAPAAVRIRDDIAGLKRIIAVPLWRRTPYDRSTDNYRPIAPALKGATGNE